MSYDVRHRHGLDAVLLWLWCRQAATVLIQPLAWEPPCAMGMALKDKRQKKKKYFELGLWENNLLKFLFVLYKPKSFGSFMIYDNNFLCCYITSNCTNDLIIQQYYINYFLKSPIEKS